MTDDERQRIANDVRITVEPLLDAGTWDGGYDCCGCSTYTAILEHCIAVILHGPGTPLPKEHKDR
jgi:hypothetical protein